MTNQTPPPLMCIKDIMNAYGMPRSRVERGLAHGFVEPVQGTGGTRRMYRREDLARELGEPWTD